MSDLARYIKHVGHKILNDRYLASQREVDRFTQDPGSVFLVSFSRTGSHWIRMIMELYFERPLLRRTFHYPGRRDYLLYHTHDMDLQIEHRNVIYLYRDPIDTIYSQLNYYKEPHDNRLYISHWTHLYAAHLAKWLVDETFTQRKTIVRYEYLRRDMANEFAKICQHFDMATNLAKLDDCVARISKENVKETTMHDLQVINLQKSYEERRVQFRNVQSGWIWDAIGSFFRTIYGDDTRLQSLFPEKAYTTAQK